MWAISPNLRIKLDKKRRRKTVWGRKWADFLLGRKEKNTRRVREGGKRKRKIKSKLLSSIHGVPSVRIRRDKNESSSTRRGLRVGIENTGFYREFKRGVREIKGLGFRKCPRDFLEFLLHSKRKGFFLLWFIFHSRSCLVAF